MRTHYLSLLAISGREKALALEPDFDFYRAKEVLKLHINFLDGDLGELPSLRLDVAYDGDSRRYELKLVFEGVRELVLPEMSPLLFIPELEIEDLRDRMMEGVHFEALSHFERAFRCTCRDIAIIEFKPF
jgi:hypothetical protein